MGISTREPYFPREAGPQTANSLHPVTQGVFTTESSLDLKPGKVLPRDSDLPYWYSLVLFRPFGGGLGEEGAGTRRHTLKPGRRF